MRPNGLGRAPTILLAVIVPVVALVTVVVTLNVTSDDTGSAATRSQGGGSGTEIDIANFRFSPNPLEVTAGTTVTVTNRDGTEHTLTAKDGAFDTGTLDGGASATITVTKAGRYRYFCQIHNYMTGTIEAR